MKYQIKKIKSILKNYGKFEVSFEKRSERVRIKWSGGLSENQIEQLLEGCDFPCFFNLDRSL